jgi:hypothetical protein
MNIPCVPDVCQVTIEAEVVEKRICDLREKAEGNENNY